LAHAYLEPSAASGVGQGHGDRYQIDGIKFQTPKCKVCRGLPGARQHQLDPQILTTIPDQKSHKNRAFARTIGCGPNKPQQIFRTPGLELDNVSYLSYFFLDTFRSASVSGKYCALCMCT
jgi:hypothetical protein